MDSDAITLRVRPLYISGSFEIIVCSLKSGDDRIFENDTALYLENENDKINLFLVIILTGTSLILWY